MNMQLFISLSRSMRQEMEHIVSIVEERGIHRFARPIILGVLAVYFCYYFLYVPPGKKAATLSRRIAAAKATAQYVDTYKTLHERLLAVYAELPLAKNKDQWLTNTVIDSMKAQSIIADSIQPPEEIEQSGFIFQKVVVNVQLGFHDAVSWLEHLEKVRPMLQVSSFVMTKRAEPLGTNAVECAISTLVPAEGLSP